MVKATKSDSLIVFATQSTGAMNNGLSRFNFYTQQVTELLNKARQENNPAMWLFNNNARTPFFMLEALAKMYANMHNARKFDKLKVHFKLIEDGLGQIDYYSWLSKAFVNNKEIPAGLKEYIKKQIDQTAADLNKVLVDKDWLSKDNKRINKIDKKLNEVDWLSPKKDVEKISAFYKESITTITKFVKKTNYHFDNIEEDVHELRRKLRWLSIYPQALQGAIQFTIENETAPHLEKYLTKDIVSSPFNTLPAVGNNTSILMINKNYFLALSWMIARLGSLKDEGLLVTGLSEAIKESTACKRKEALAKAYTLLGEKQRKMQEILDDAEAITITFFKEGNLQYLITKKTN